MRSLVELVKLYRVLVHEAFSRFEFVLFHCLAQILQVSVQQLLVST